MPLTNQFSKKRHHSCRLLRGRLLSSSGVLDSAPFSPNKNHTQLKASRIEILSAAPKSNMQSGADVQQRYKQTVGEHLSQMTALSTHARTWRSKRLGDASEQVLHLDSANLYYIVQAETSRYMADMSTQFLLYFGDSLFSPLCCAARRLSRNAAQGRAPVRSASSRGVFPQRSITFMKAPPSSTSSLICTTTAHNHLKVCDAQHLTQQVQLWDAMQLAPHRPTCPA